MPLWDRLWRRAPPPAPPSLKDARSYLTLQSAPAYHPLPIQAGDAVDADLIALWAAYQRANPKPCWAMFMAQLKAENDDLAARVQKADEHLADYDRWGTFTP